METLRPNKVGCTTALDLKPGSGNLLPPSKLSTNLSGLDVIFYTRYLPRTYHTPRTEGETKKTLVDLIPGELYLSADPKKSPAHALVLTKKLWYYGFLS